MVELSEVIRELRRELGQAIVESDGEPLRFKLGIVELELSVVLEHQAGVGARVRFLVVDLGADGKAGRVATQRIKLTLEPTVAGSHTDVLVSGDEAVGER